MHETCQVMNMEKLKVDKLLRIGDVIKTEDARINYLRGLIRIAECDKSKTSDEEGYIYKIAEIIGSSYSEIWKAQESWGSDLCTEVHFASSQEKTLFLMQALYLCWLDDDYSETERKEIIEIGNELGISPAEIEKIEAWIKQGIEWLGDGAEMLRLE